MTVELGLGQTKARLGYNGQEKKNGHSEGHLAIGEKTSCGLTRSTDELKE